MRSQGRDNVDNLFTLHEGKLECLTSWAPLSLLPRT